MVCQWFYVYDIDENLVKICEDLNNLVENENHENLVDTYENDEIQLSNLVENEIDEIQLRSYENENHENLDEIDEKKEEPRRSFYDLYEIPPLTQHM